MAVDREFVHIFFDPDGTPGPPWGSHGAPMVLPWRYPGTIWDTIGTAWAPIDLADPKT